MKLSRVLFKTLGASGKNDMLWDCFEQLWVISKRQDIVDHAKSQIIFSDVLETKRVTRACLSSIHMHPRAKSALGKWVRWTMMLTILEQSSQISSCEESNRGVARHKKKTRKLLLNSDFSWSISIMLVKPCTFYCNRYPMLHTGYDIYVGIILVDAVAAGVGPRAVMHSHTHHKRVD